MLVVLSVKMKTISFIAFCLIMCSCVTRKHDVTSTISLENYGYCGNKVIVLRDGCFVQLLKPLSHQGWVEDVNQIDLSIAENPFIQAYQSDHFGNGTFAVYECSHHGGLICVLAIHGYDYHGDSMTFKNGRVNPEYRDVNGDGYTDIVISAEIEHWDEGDNIIDKTPMRRVFVWKQDEDSHLSFTHNGEYEELVNERVGIIRNDGFMNTNNSPNT